MSWTEINVEKISTLLASVAPLIAALGGNCCTNSYFASVEQALTWDKDLYPEKDL